MLPPGRPPRGGDAPSYRRELESCSLFYWTSFPQYQAFAKAFPLVKGKAHACGPGKTYRAFCEHGVGVTLFLGPEDLRRWIGNA